MHFAIVEDLKIDQNHLIHLIQENLEKHGETAHFDCYESGEAFLEAFRPGLFNAVFMDIMLDRDGRNGIDTAMELRKCEKRLPIVFTTSERDYSLQGYRAHPLDYLLKPVEEKALAWCLDEIRTFLAAPAYIEIQAALGRGQASTQRILLDDFLYAETQNHRLIIHTSSGDTATRISFSELMALLPKGSRFYMSGRGLLINFSQVTSVDEDGSVHLKTAAAFSAAAGRKKRQKKHLQPTCLTHCGREVLYELVCVWQGISR